MDHDINPAPESAPDVTPRSRRGTLRILGFLLAAPVLAACNEVRPGSGTDGIRRTREQPSGR